MVSTRNELLKKAKHKCQSCGWNKDPNVLVIHHKIPQAVGGTSEDNNLVVLCPNCHALAHARINEGARGWWNSEGGKQLLGWALRGKGNPSHKSKNTSSD